MKFAQSLSCHVLTPTCLVDQMDSCREKNFQASVEHLCRLTVVSIYHPRLVCFRSSMSIAAFLLLNSFVEFKPLDCLRNQSNRLSLTMIRTVSFKRLPC